MNKVIEIIASHTNYIILTFGTILVGIVLTFIVNFAAGKLKFAKYLPGLLFIAVGVFSLFIVINRLFDAESLDNLVIFVTGVSSGIISLIFALIIGISTNDKNRYKKKNSNNKKISN